MNKIRQRLIDMEESAFCFSHLIMDYLNKEIEDRNVLIPLEHHLKVCEKCAKEKETQKALLESPGGRGDLGGDVEIESLPAFAAFKEEFERVSQKHRGDRKPEMNEGQVWTTPGFPNYILYQYNIKDKPLPYSLDPRPFLVYRCEKETGTAFGFPINSSYLEFASDFDLIVAEDETELEFEFMVETWNQMSTSQAFLQKYWGTLPVKIMKKVQVLVLEFNGFEVQGEVPANIVTGKPIEAENDIRNRFQQLEHRITEYISAPFIEKEEFEAFKNKTIAEKILETMIIYSVVHIHRHKDFLRMAGEKEGESRDEIHIYSKDQPVFAHRFTLKISINDMKKEKLLQFRVLDNETNEENRGFIVDIIEWEDPFPESKETLKITYLLLKEKGEKVTHTRLWEKEKRIAIPEGKNVILGIYKPDDKKQIECIPIDLNVEEG